MPYPSLFHTVTVEIEVFAPKWDVKLLYLLYKQCRRYLYELSYAHKIFQLLSCIPYGH